MVTFRYIVRYVDTYRYVDMYLYRYVDIYIAMSISHTDLVTKCINHNHI